MDTHVRLLEVLTQGAVTAAEQLIGWRLYVIEPDGQRTGGPILETEAYSQEDAASHTYRGKTKRNATMFGPPGHVYVYFTYGMHWCMNIVTGQEGHGQGVLIRAIAIDSGLDIVRGRRGPRPDRELTNGPAKVAQALGVLGADNGAPLNHSRFILLPPHSAWNATVKATERIGISKDTHRLWRFIADEESTNR